MIIEILILALTPISTYRILRSFNVGTVESIVISLIYLLLLYTFFEWIMLVVGVMVVTLLAAVTIRLMQRRGASKGDRDKTNIML